jgi:branched-chain amino acid transport system permease protein
MFEDDLFDQYDEDVSVRSAVAGLDPRSMALRHQLGLLGLLALFVLPTQLYAVQVSPLTPVIYLMIFAISWDFVSGYTGQLSFGHAFFFALGGYGTSILNIQHGVDPLVSIPIAVLLAGLGGLLIGLPAIRLQGPYLSLVTLIVPVIMAQLIIIWNESLVLTLGSFELPIAPGGLGGESGLDTAPDPLISTEQAAMFTVENFQLSALGNYYLALTAMTVILVVLLAITKSSTGTVMTAIRENETVVTATGLNPFKFKLFAFVVSALVGGLGGALFVHSPVGFPQPDAILNLQLNIDVILVSIIGGMGTLVGPIIGAMFMEILDQLFAEADFVIPILGRSLEDMDPLPVLGLTVLVLYYMPGGILRQAIGRGRRLDGVTDPDADVSDEARTPVESIIHKYRREIRDRLG